MSAFKLVTTEQHVRFAILCAREVCRDPKWAAWADSWLSGEDRSEDAARAATWAAAHAEAAARVAAEAMGAKWTPSPSPAWAPVEAAEAAWEAANAAVAAWTAEADAVEEVAVHAAALASRAGKLDRIELLLAAVQ